MYELFLDTKQGRVFGMAAGDPANEVILGLHGWSQRNGWHTWRPLMTPLSSAGYYVVSVDMPGWGRSMPHPEGPLSHRTAIAVTLAILDVLAPETQAVLMGKSWGGGLALSIALDFPERVSRLILTAPAFSDFERLPALRQSTLLAWAEDDKVIPVHYAAEYKRAPNLQSVVYPTGGHNAAPENAADFAPKAIRFLAG